MTLLKGQLRTVEGPLAGSVLSGPAELRSRSFLVLRLQDSDGLYGLGEASPLPGYSSDRLEEASQELFRLCGPGLQLGSEPQGLAWVEAVLADQALQSPAARFALETALLDWFGKRRGVPLHRLLSASTVQAGSRIAKLVPQRDASRWLDWVRTQAAPDDSVKLKVGRDFDAELLALGELRAAFPALRIRLDANRQLTGPQVLSAVEDLRRLRLELFEEPVPAAQWDEVLGLGLPLALDESLRSDANWADWIASGSICALVLKPTVLAGVLACRRLAEQARSLGVRCVVSHCFEGPVARAAMAELSLSLEQSLRPGLGAHSGLELWPRHAIAAVRGSELRAHGEPGLGLSFEEPFDG